MSDLERLARKIWFGKYPRTGSHKWAELPQVIDRLAADHWPHYRWLDAGDYRVKFEGAARGAFLGRVYVEKKGRRWDHEAQAWKPADLKS